MKPPRRPVTPPLPDSLPARTPGEDPITRLTEERDGVMVSLDLMAKERDGLAAERDDLAARSLPCYGTATSWPLLPDQGTPIGDELAAQYGGWWA